MQNKIITYTSLIFLICVFGGFGIFAFMVQENGQIDTQEHFSVILTFLVLAIIGFLITAIGLAAKNQEGSKINKRTVFTGIVIAIFFIIWRITVSI
ncbi:hypothetical protein SM124_22255 [Bacillus sp. 31A1R]|uniref:DUF4064 domain-containing protein n=1 Tax=Robertmurraya mangrovi TaxID=3098077 RepID=A0ABU5J519_9BACI|nr:hypothetical protein [Bacillus sp. 31A1R]MDZ5474421.1 hypothetical protein [Bacillus sp. 31A1R]